jgi:FMN-dependent oxidoreductase (nitrilotriacetate monooxygenase family)
MAERKFHLALALYGVGAPGQHNLWKDPRVPKNASIDIKWYIQQAQKAEAAKFDTIFIVDSLFINSTYPSHYLNRLEPLTLLSALATVTENIGLVGTMTSSYNSPFNLTRRLASLDMISGGRAGWNVVTSFDLGVAGNFGLDEHYDYDTRYGRAQEFVDVAKGLWDSYEDDAFTADVERDDFLDPDKLHVLNHKGEYFSVTGPLNISRSPQGQPVIFQSGMSEQGRNFAGHVAEGIYTHVGSIEEGVEFGRDIRSRAAALGRNPDDIIIFPGARPIIADTDAQAQQIARDVYEFDNTFSKKLGAFARPFGGYDFSQHDPDGPFPDLGTLGDNSRAGSVSEIKHVAREEKLSIRQVVERFSQFKPNPYAGSAQSVADTIERYFLAGAYDGLNVSFRVTDDLDTFIERVVPILQAKGIFRTEYESSTLRGNLGLPIPENRYTKARREAADTAQKSMPDETAVTDAATESVNA